MSAGRHDLTPAQRGHVRDMLARAIEMEPDALRAFLDRAADPIVREEVRSLLAYQEVLDEDDGPPAALDAMLADAATREDDDLGIDAGTTIGPYTVVRELGRGGFGVVFEAEQTEPVRRRVALKIIKPGMDSKSVLSRFSAERQALARMDHPCVARVYDAGATPDGRPYVAMELVDQDAITRHCDHHRLPVRERVALFIRVCEGVQHAHGKGVIHRDLKPSNILVESSDGVRTPKIIDFGIAKALDQPLTEATIFTGAGQLMGTPEYMSPEQAVLGEADIDTRADVYALGVLLYELLTGARPFDRATLRSADLAEIQRIIRQVDPPRPSTRLHGIASDAERARSIAEARSIELRALTGALRRDLDWIVMRCLEKDRDRRYATASELAMDLRRFLRDEPVLAGPPGIGYRLGKFAARHRGAVAAAVVAAVLVAGGLVGTSYGLVEARREARQRAEVTDFQSGQLGTVDPQRMGVGIRRTILAAVPEARRLEMERALTDVNFTSVAMATLEKDIFERSVAAIDAQFAAQPVVQAELLQTVADTARELGALGVAQDPQERARDPERARLGAAHPDTLHSVGGMGELLLDLGRFDDADPYYQQALDGTRLAFGPTHRQTAAALGAMAWLRTHQERIDEAEDLYREALAVHRRASGPDSREVVGATSSLGGLLWKQGRNAEAEPLLREAIESAQRLLGADSEIALVSSNNLALLLLEEGRLDEAEPLFVELLEIRRRQLGDEHPRTLMALNNVGGVLMNQRRLAEARPYFEEALDLRRRLLGPDHADTLQTINNMAGLLRRLGDLEGAEAMYREALATHDRIHEPDHATRLIALNNFGGVLLQQEKFAGAEAAFREAYERRRSVFGDDRYETIMSMHNLGSALRGLDRLDEAEPMGAGAVERSRRVLGDDDWRTGVFLANHAKSLEMLGRFEDAASAAIEAHGILDAAGHPRAAGVAAQIVALHDAWEQAAPGEGHAETAEEWRAR